MSKSKIRLVGCDSETNQEKWTRTVAENLRSAADMIEKGEHDASGMALTVTYTDGDIGTFFSGRDHIHLIGAIEYLKMCVLSEEEISHEE